jgi:hypothetical protein
MIIHGGLNRDCVNWFLFESTFLSGILEALVASRWRDRLLAMIEQ